MLSPMEEAHQFDGVLQQTEPEAGEAATTNGSTTAVAPPNNLALAVMSDQAKSQAKRLHVSNIPFRFRDPDLRAMFGVMSTG
ncbi:regulation of alternative mRNA splicing, via spliceosome [Homalodisca vitripennis]|nr:regulation of alternative mRNA splicing, via spliceosome [Homalodisca vitripennis]